MGHARKRVTQGRVQKRKAEIGPKISNHVTPSKCRGHYSAWLSKGNVENSFRRDHLQFGSYSIQHLETDSKMKTCICNRRRSIGKPSRRQFKTVEFTGCRDVQKMCTLYRAKKFIYSRIWRLRAFYETELTHRVIKTVLKSITVALNDPQNTCVERRHYLATVVSHMYGDHTLCFRKWCEFSFSATNIESQQTRQLSDPSLRVKLEKTMETVIEFVERIAPRRSKRIRKQFCSDARRDDFNIVCTANICSCDLRLVDCKQTSSLDPSFQPEDQHDAVDGKAILEIPPPISPPVMKPVLPPNMGVQQVFFDIETTSLSLDCDIIQIAAKHESSHFNVYILPTKPIEKGASEVTGLRMVNDRLCYKGQPVEGRPHLEAVNEFMGWLDNIEGSVVMYGHNCRTFDCPRLLRLLQRCGFDGPFSEKVIGFVDTLHLFRQIAPGQSSYRQESLSANLLGAAYDAHNALEDVRGLQNLVKGHSPVTEEHLNHSFTVKSAIDGLQYNIGVHQRLRTLQGIVKQGALSKTMARKVAQSGLCLNDILSAFKEDPENGIQRVFSAKHTGVVRVSACKRVIRKVQLYFEFGSDMDIEF